MFSKGQGKTMGTYYTLLNALAEDGRLEEAEELWMKIFSENLENLPRVFFMKMMSLYYDQGMYEKMFEVNASPVSSLCFMLAYLHGMLFLMLIVKCLFMFLYPTC